MKRAVPPMTPGRKGDSRVLWELSGKRGKMEEGCSSVKLAPYDAA